MICIELEGFIKRATTFNNNNKVKSFTMKRPLETDTPADTFRLIHAFAVGTTGKWLYTNGFSPSEFPLLVAKR